MTTIPSLARENIKFLFVWLLSPAQFASEGYRPDEDISLFQRTWKLGRVAAVYKGTDGLVRVVDVTNGQKTYRRPVHKLVKLHEENDFSCRGEDVRAASGNDTPSPSSE